MTESGIVLFRRSTDGRRVSFITPNVESVLGYTVGEILSSENFFKERMHPDELVQLERETDHDFRFLHPDGSYRWLRGASVLEEGGSGDEPMVVGYLIDVTDLKLRQDEVRWQRRELAAAHEEVLMLRERLAGSREGERKRIANDIHDDTVSALSAVSLRLASLKRHLSDPEQIEIAGEAQEAVSSALRRLRHLLFELEPRLIRSEGLGPALRLLLERLRAETDVDWRLDDRHRPDVDPEMDMVAFRVAQEAITNVRKHARATIAHVELTDRAGGLAVRISDDGVGFDGSVAGGKEPGHMGLPAMRERVEEAGGTFRIDPSPGRGTTLDFWLPRAEGPPRRHRSRPAMIV